MMNEQISIQNRLANEATALVVSPYIDEWRPQFERLYEKISEPSDRRAFKVMRASEDIRLVFDCLTSAFIAVTRADQALLTKLRDTPFALHDLNREDAEAVERLKQAGAVLAEEDAHRVHNYDQVSIEINSHCNFRCQFCPVAEDPLPKRIMPLDLYGIVLDRAVEGGIKRVALNHYGEPSLDPNLVDRVRLAKEADLHVDLNTNASRLERRKLEELAAFDNLSLIVNLPTIEPDEYRRITGSKMLDRVLDNLRAASDLDMDVKVTVNAPVSLWKWQRYRLRRNIRRRTGIQVSLPVVQSRAGFMTNEEYAPPIRHSGQLNGCYRMLTKIVVNIDAKAFLCCQDYHQEYILGDLRTSSFEDIARSDSAVQLRRWLFGAEDPPDGFICRRCEETQTRVQRLAVGSPHRRGVTLSSVALRSALPASRPA